MIQIQMQTYTRRQRKVLHYPLFTTKDLLDWPLIFSLLEQIFTVSEPAVLHDRNQFKAQYHR